MKRGEDHHTLILPGMDCTFSSVVVPQADGSYLVKPGKPIITGDEIPVNTAAKILGLSERRVLSMIEEGRFPSANQPGGKSGKWLLSRSEVIGCKSAGFLFASDAT